MINIVREKLVIIILHIERLFFLFSEIKLTAIIAF